MIPDLNATAGSLLGFLEEGETTGYGLAKVAEELIGPFWSITRSQVYRELTNLSERGLIEAAEAGPRSSRPYRLTREGHEAFLRWVSEPPAAEHIRFPLLLTLSFGRWLSPATVRTIVAEHRQVHVERLAQYNAIGDLSDPHQVAVLSFGIHYERAVLAWIDELPPPIRG